MRHAIAAFLASPLALGAAHAVTVASALGGGSAITVAEDGEVVVTFGGESGAFTKDLYLVNEEGEDLFVFDGATAAVGETFSLGSFAAGTELVFRLFIENHGYDVFSGDANRNAGGYANGRAQAMAGRVVLVSFEDLLRGGDEDFNDFGFTLTNADAIPNPLPGAAVLMGTGVAGLLAARRRRRA
jgi:hypothetical protein